MAWWYVRRVSGEAVGPLNESGVEAELLAGRLMPDGWVCPCGENQWVPVRAQGPFAPAVQRAILALGDAPTAYAQDESKQRQLAALYEARIEAEPAPGPPSAGAAVPINPLTEPFGPIGWSAILASAATPVVTLTAAVLEILLTGAFWWLLPTLASAPCFGWATVAMARRKFYGFRVAFSVQGVLLALAALLVIVTVAMSGFRAMAWVGLGLIVWHAVAMGLLHSARSLFWIRS